MASNTFRDSINNLGWSRREADIPVNTSRQTGGLLSSLQSLNPFGDRGYVQLPTTEGPGAALPAPNRREEEEGWFACESTCFSRPLSPHAAFPCLGFPFLDSRYPCRRTPNAGHVPVLHGHASDRPTVPKGGAAQACCRFSLSSLDLSRRRLTVEA